VICAKALEDEAIRVFASNLQGSACCQPPPMPGTRCTGLDPGLPYRGLGVVVDATASGRSQYISPNAPRNHWNESLAVLRPAEQKTQRDPVRYRQRYASRETEQNWPASCSSSRPQLR